MRGGRAARGRRGAALPPVPGVGRPRHAGRGGVGPARARRVAALGCTADHPRAGRRGGADRGERECGGFGGFGDFVVVIVGFVVVIVVVIVVGFVVVVVVSSCARVTGPARFLLKAAAVACLLL